jgi:hypothetical protein
MMTTLAQIPQITLPNGVVISNLRLVAGGPVSKVAIFTAKMGNLGYSLSRSLWKTKEGDRYFCRDNNQAQYDDRQSGERIYRGTAVVQADALELETQAAMQLYLLKLKAEEIETAKAGASQSTEGDAEEEAEEDATSEVEAPSEEAEVS